MNLSWGFGGLLIGFGTVIGFMLGVFVCVKVIDFIEWVAWKWKHRRKT